MSRWAGLGALWSHSFLWQMCARRRARPCEAGSSVKTVGASVPQELQSRGHGRKEEEVEGEPEAPAGSRWWILQQRIPGGKGNLGDGSSFALRLGRR